MPGNAMIGKLELGKATVESRFVAKIPPPLSLCAHKKSPDASPGFDFYVIDLFRGWRVG
jgi:hypothetical protein